MAQEHHVEHYRCQNTRQLADHCQDMADRGWRLVYRGQTDVRHAISSVPPSYTTELHWVRDS